MTNKNGTGPRSSSIGPRDGTRNGRLRASSKGIGKKKGGKKGKC